MDNKKWWRREDPSAKKEEPKEMPQGSRMPGLDIVRPDTTGESISPQQEADYLNDVFRRGEEEEEELPN